MSQSLRALSPQVTFQTRFKKSFDKPTFSNRSYPSSIYLFCCRSHVLPFTEVWLSFGTLLIKTWCASSWSKEHFLFLLVCRYYVCPTRSNAPFSVFTVCGFCLPSWVSELCLAFAQQATCDPHNSVRLSDKTVCVFPVTQWRIGARVILCKPFAIFDVLPSVFHFHQQNSLSDHGNGSYGSGDP